MTPTEIIAVKLCGWERSKRDTEDSRTYHHPRGSTAYVGGKLDGCGFGPAGGEDWPDLEDWNWIRRMEDALAERGSFSAYMNALAEGQGITTESAQNGIYNRYKLDAFNALRATAEQRVAAAVKVLEGVK